MTTREPNRTYDAGNRWDSATRVPHTGYMHGAVEWQLDRAPVVHVRPMPDIERELLATAHEVHARAIENGATVATIGSVADIADSLRERVATESRRLARAPHTFIRNEAPTGARAPITGAPDVHERVRASVKTRRTNSGRTERQVVTHGRAYVIGRTIENGRTDLHALMVANILDTTPRATIGHDATSITNATNVIYGRSIPALIGADVLAFHEWRDTGTVRTGTYRPVRRATRYRLATLRARAAELRMSQPRVTSILADGRTDTLEWHDATVAALLAPTGDADTAFVGFRRIVRPVTVRDERAQRARPVDHEVSVRERDDLAVILSEHLATLAPGTRINWAHGATHGAATVSAKGLYSVSGLPGAKVKNLTTRAALANAIARAQVI
jgi:hypothetical protein